MAPRVTCLITSRDPKNQGRVPDIHGCKYLKTVTDTLGSKGPPIGNNISLIEWLRDLNFNTVT